MKIIIGGDLFPTKGNRTYFSSGELNKIIDEFLFDKISKADLFAFNLEAPLIDGGVKINKNGSNLKAPTSSINGIKSLNPALIFLANNHIMDYGEEGLNSTLEILENNKIKYIGVGKIDNLKTSKIIHKNGLKIGFYNLAEREFNIAEEGKLGAAPYLENITHAEIISLSKKVDYLIVIYHGGPEHYRYPTPNLQKRLRGFVDMGANLVISQHSHCVGSKEEYNDSVIIYGQGNFLFNSAKMRNEFWNNGLLIEVDLTSVKTPLINYIPIITSDIGIYYDKAEGEEILNSFFQRSKQISDKDFVLKAFNDFSQNRILNYLRRIQGGNKIINAIDRHFFNNYFLKRKYNISTLSAFLNYIRCESHYEVLMEGLEFLIDEK